MDQIEDLIRTWEPRLREAFMNTIRDIRDAARIERLARLIEAGNLDGVIAELGLEAASFRPFESVIYAAYESGGVDITVRISRLTRGAVARPVFDPRTPASVAWLTDHATRLIREITEDQRELVRQRLAPLASGQDRMITGETPQKIALDLVGRINRATRRREGGIIGLTSSQAKWVRNYEEELRGERPLSGALDRALRDKRFDRRIERALRTGEPIPEETIQKMVAAYRNRALRRRGEAIAQNEAHQLLHRAQFEAWDQAIQRGVVPETRVRRFWRDRADARVRPWHSEVKHMNAKGVALRQAFQTPVGPAMNPGWEFEPGCRCRVTVDLVEEP